MTDAGDLVSLRQSPSAQQDVLALEGPGELRCLTLFTFSYCFWLMLLSCYDICQFRQIHRRENI